MAVAQQAYSFALAALGVLLMNASGTSSVVSLLVIVAMWLGVWTYQTRSERRNYPPGPFPLPLIGNIAQLLLIVKKMGKKGFLPELKRQYGDLVSLRIGQLDTVIITGGEAMQEAFLTNKTVLSDRPNGDNFPLFATFSEQIGLGINIGKYDCPWAQFRSKLLEGISGEGKLQSKIMEEVKVIIDVVQGHEGQPYKMYELLDNASLNVMSNVYFGKRFDYDDVILQELKHHVTTNLSHKELFAQPINFFPFLKLFPPMRKLSAFANKLREGDEFFNKTFVERIRSDYSSDVTRHVVDALISLEERKKLEGDVDNFTGIKLRRPLIESFVNQPGFGAALHWVFLYLSTHTDVQDRCWEEINLVVGGSREVSLTDRERLVYTEATVLEAVRMGVIAPFTVPHSPSSDVTLGSFTIPKKSWVVADLNRVCRDPDLYPEPNLFKPERFLSTDATDTEKTKLLAFGIGPRQCAGKELVLKVLFLVTSNLVQQFTVRPLNPESCSLDPDPTSKFAIRGLDHELVFERRKFGSLVV